MNDRAVAVPSSRAPLLQFLISTGRHHEYESLAEARLLLMLGIAGELTEVLAQPPRLRYLTDEGAANHTPEFSACTESGDWLRNGESPQSSSARLPAAVMRYRLVSRGHRPGTTVSRNRLQTRVPRVRRRPASGWSTTCTRSARSCVA